MRTNGSTGRGKKKAEGRWVAFSASKAAADGGPAAASEGRVGGGGGGRRDSGGAGGIGAASSSLWVDIAGQRGRWAQHGMRNIDPANVTPHPPRREMHAGADNPPALSFQQKRPCLDAKIRIGPSLCRRSP